MKLKREAKTEGERNLSMAVAPMGTREGNIML